MGTAKRFKEQGGPLTAVKFLVRGPSNSSAGAKHFNRLEDAWRAGSEVLVVDRFGQEHSLYNAYLRGMIYLMPILPKRRHCDPV